MITRMLRAAYARAKPLQSLRSSRLHLSSVAQATRLGALPNTARRRALALLWLGGTTASAATYLELREKRRLQCDAARWVNGSSRETERQLTSNSETYIPNASSGFARFDFAQLGSNEPIEDYHAELLQPTKHWSFFAILDGHAGWSTAAWLSEHLLPSLSRSLHAGSESGDQDKIIAETFLQLDREIVDDAAELALASTSQYHATKVLERANAGSCAIVSFYDSETRTLKVANTGDCRAILGRRTTSADGKVEYVVKVLSFDHNGDNEAEVKRLTALHPDEKLFEGSRFIGWGPSRAFGDGRTKWSKEVQTTLQNKYLGSTPAKTLITPPYFTAEPEITTTKVEKGDILIMATDGLWECLTNDEAVGLVGQWVERQVGAVEGTGESLPVKLREVPEAEFCRYKQWRKEKRFAFVDGDTPAQHLLRNALGGADEDLRQALLSLRSPRSRSFRDDISTTVVMF